MDRGTIRNGKLDIRSTKAHQPGTLDALVANGLTNAMLGESEANTLEKGYRLRRSQMPSGSVNH